MDASGAKPKLLGLSEKLDVFDVMRLEVAVVVSLLPPDSLSSISVGSSVAATFGVVVGDGSEPAEDGGVAEDSPVEVGVGERNPDEIESDDTERALSKITT